MQNFYVHRSKKKMYSAQIWTFNRVFKSRKIAYFTCYTLVFYKVSLAIKILRVKLTTVIFSIVYMFGKVYQLIENYILKRIFTFNYKKWTYCYLFFFFKKDVDIFVNLRNIITYFICWQEHTEALKSIYIYYMLNSSPNYFLLSNYFLKNDAHRCSHRCSCRIYRVN